MVKEGDVLPNDDSNVSEMKLSLEAKHWIDEPSAEVESWADSCLVFNDDNSCINLSKELLDAVLNEDSHFSEQLDVDASLLSPSSKSNHVSAAEQPSSSDEPLTSSVFKNQAIDGNAIDFNYEETDDATRIRYCGEEYVLFTGNAPVMKDEDPILEELDQIVLKDVESENIFRVWDLGTPEDNEEDEFELELRKALGEDNFGTSHRRSSPDDPIAALSMQELDDVVKGITDLSLADSSLSPPQSPSRSP